jgi:undecaprenyl pyrophosphate phosphatase UppP
MLAISLSGAESMDAYDIKLISIPVLVVFMITDLIGLVTVGSGLFTFVIFIQYVLSGIAAFVGSYVAIHFMRFLVVSSGFAGFAYYSWGAALFSMILYLTT